MTQAAPDRIRLKPWRIVAIAMLAALAVLAALLVGVYLDRRQIAREAVTGWLRSKGVASDSAFQTVAPGRIVGRIRIGPAGAADLTVDRVEIDYSLADLLGGRGLHVTSVRLVRPVLKASWSQGQFRAGALDRLIAAFRKTPSPPAGAAPRIEIDQGRLVLTTDYGLVRASVDALVEKGRLQRLDARTAPGSLRFGKTQAELGVVTLQAQMTGDRLTASLSAPILQAAGNGAVLRGGQLLATSLGSYPDTAAGDAASGHAEVDLRAASASKGGARAKSVRLAATTAWRWTRSGGDRLSGDLKLSGQAADVTGPNLRLATAGGEFEGRFTLGPDSSLRLAGQAQASGGWTGLGRPSAGEAPEVAALKRGLAAFRATVAGLAVAADRKGLRLELTAPVRLQPERGGEIRIAPQGRGYRLTSAGGGLPQVDASAERVYLTPGGATVLGAVTARVSAGPLQDAKLKAAGTLRIARGAASFTARRCAQIAVARVDLGANALDDLNGELCPTGGPMLQISNGGWRLAAQARDVSAAASFVQARVEQGAGALAMQDRSGRLSADLQVAGVRVEDAATPARFHPLLVSGHADLRREQLAGGFEAALPGGAPILHADVRLDGRTGAGAVDLATPLLTFAKGGLQPTEISELGAALGATVEGEARFAGAFRWTKAGVTSNGQLTIPTLAFMSPAGAVSGLSGAIRFSSLAPLTAPAGQILHVDRLAAALPIANATVSLGLQDTRATVEAEGAAGGGRLWLHDLVLPLANDAPVTGELQLSGVQLHDLVEASPFGDRVDLDARVSGRIPFKVQGGKIAISGGELHAVAPGRLSIQRAALTSVSAEGQAAAPGGASSPNDTFTDFAYQAMENLAFRTLDAQVNSRPGGRLGVLFHIVGYHDPPKRQEITISLWDLIRRKFLNRKLPLPSGTGVDLTLDTTVNLDDLLNDYAEFERLRSSPPVQ